MGKMASSDVVTEVEIQPEIQEVEIEAIPVEMPVETVVTTVESVEGQPMIALQPLPEPGREEIILQTQEEIVGSIDADHEALSGYDNIPVPTPEVLIETSPSTSGKRGRKGKRGGKGRGFGGELTFETDRSTRKWEQKQVQIKTLEGEFSVTMWASGTEDGRFIFEIILEVSSVPANRRKNIGAAWIAKNVAGALSRSPRPRQRRRWGCRGTGPVCRTLCG